MILVPLLLILVPLLLEPLLLLLVPRLALDDDGDVDCGLSSLVGVTDPPKDE